MLMPALWDRILYRSLLAVPSALIWLATSDCDRNVRAAADDARVMHENGPGREATAVGVPKLTVDYDQEVDTWWAAHRFNPQSPNHAPEIRSPKPVIDVAEVHAMHTHSETAGIQEALQLLPEAGGTLFFAKTHGPYVVTKEPLEARNRYRGFAPIQILRRSNIHFVSDGATIKGKSAIRISSQEFADHRNEDNPVRNFYLAGQPVRLRLVLEDADVYSFRFVP